MATSGRPVKWRKSKKPATKTCNHCKKPIAYPRARGLCWVCNGSHEIREQYAESKYAPRGRCHEPTEAEVEAMVAEGYRNLPSWWESSWPKGGYRDD